MQAGDLLGERFRIDRLAGSGGMGAVYAAVDEPSRARVAIKVMRESSADLERFTREAQLLSQLEHSHIVRYVAHGLTPAGDPFLAMEWLDGEDLASCLRRGSLAVADALAVIRCAAGALGAAHTRGIIHRDIKPSNLFVVGSRLDDVRVIDFGVARRGGEARMTGSGAVIGTLGYMAPEQASGAPSVDARADVFSLGCVLYECLTGRPPFSGEHLVAVLTKVLFEEPMRVRQLRSGISAALDDLVARMLAKDAAQRFASGTEVVDAIDALVALGGNLEQQAGPVVPALTEAEQRGVSIVLAASRVEDLAHAETAAEAAVTTAADLRQAIAADGGVRIASLAGGALAVIVSGQSSPRDQATIAARAALAIRSNRPDTAIAVVTGRALLAGSAPVGEAIDRAARLLRESEQSAGAPILVDSVTADLIVERFAVTTDTVGHSILAGDRGGHDGTRTLLGRATPFVGRERELQFMLGLAGDAFAEPVARVMLVTAPAGTGKSRLRRELVSALLARVPSASVWLARGESVGAGSPFGMLGRALRSAFAPGIDPGALTARDVLARVERVGEISDRLELAEFLGEIMGVRFPDEDRPRLRAARQDPAVMGDHLRRAWLDWVRLACQSAPLVIVLEDLHWGDLSTITFVDDALAQLKDRPLVVLALARPEVRQLFPDLWTQRDPQELRLGMLTRSSSAKLVREILRERIAEPELSQLVDCAAGHAFFLEELIRAHAAGTARDPATTLLAIVHARLEALPALARQVLRAASVFGEVFHRDAIEALLAGLPASDLDSSLALLVEREVIVRRRGGLFEELAFRHAIVRDAAYAMLTDTDRALGHRLAGHWLEHNADPDAMTLAEHFERGGEPERAITWFERAATQALEGNDLTAAIARAERGIACGARGADRGALLLAQAAALDWRGENARAAEAAGEAMRKLERGGESWFVAASELAVACRRLGRREELLHVGTELRVLAELPAASGAMLRSAARAANQLTLASFFDLAAGVLDGIARHEAAVLPHDPLARAWVLAARGIHTMLRGDPSVLARDAAAAIAGADESGDRRSGCNIRLYAGIALHAVGVLERSECVLREAVELADATGAHTMRTTCASELANVLLTRGRHDEALAVIAQVPDAMLAQGDRMQEANARRILAMILLALGDLPGAEGQARSSLAGAPDGSPFRAQMLTSLAKILAAAGRLDEARAEVERALAEIGENPRSFAASEVCLVAAEIFRATGDAAAARAHAERARGLLEASVARFSDPSCAETYLSRIAANARIVQLPAEPAT